MSNLVDVPRPSWDLWFLRQAYIIAERGSCKRKQVGALIVRDRDHRVISGGYNGAPRGMPECLEAGCDVRLIDGRESCVRTIHAESNAIDLCGPIAEPHTLYATVIPCKLCALRIVQAGITRVVFHEYYQSQSTAEVADIFARKDPASLAKYADLYRDLGPARPRVVLEQFTAPMTWVKASYKRIEEVLQELKELK